MRAEKLGVKRGGGVAFTKQNQKVLRFKKKKNPNIAFRFVPVSEMDTFCSLPTIRTQGCFLKVVEIVKL